MLGQETQSSQQTNSLIGIEFFSQKKLDACTHCGLCLPTCPTYRELGLETDSPRGRLYLMSTAFRDVDPTPINEDWAKYIYRCLDCRACETACPSGVQFGELVEEARAIYELNAKRPKKYKMWTNLVFKGLLPKRIRLNLIFEFLWLYQRLGIRSLVRWSGILKIMGKMGEMEAMMPEVPNPALKLSLRKFAPAKGKAKYRVGFVSGCVMNQLFTHTNLATVRVLQENGCDVLTPRKQTCCGALHVHNGVRDVALGLARQNIDAFEDESLDAIVINSAGCGATLKEYDALMEHDAEYAEKAKKFTEKMRDISEFLAEIGITPPGGEIKRCVTYDEPCHLVHGQNVHDQPRQLLQSIPGLDFVELRESEWCCGSAGIYNITQPDMSRSILERKMKHIADTQAEIVATGNPGCILQIQLGLRERGVPMKVMHPIDLLDCAYRGVDPLA